VEVITVEAEGRSPVHLAAFVLPRIGAPAALGAAEDVARVALKLWLSAEMPVEVTVKLPPAAAAELAEGLSECVRLAEDCRTG
jgi:hypothetical protein